MTAAELFNDVVKSYTRLLSLSEKSAPSLRAYCRSRHVSYRDFIRWASTDETASCLLEKERKAKQSKKERGYNGCNVFSPLPSCKEETSGQSLLYPLQIISTPPGNVVEHTGGSSKLRGVSIRFPNGVKVTVREADSAGIIHLVHGYASSNDQ